MNEKEMIDVLDRIQNLCGLVVNPMVLAKQQGRMLSLDEARKMDQLSGELLESTNKLSGYSFSSISSPDLKCRAEVLVNLSKNALKLVLQSDTVPARPRRKTVPRAASASLGAYALAS